MHSMDGGVLRHFQRGRTDSHGGNLFCLDRIFVGLDHLLNHLTAYGACLLGGEVTVVALFERNTNLG